MCRTLVWKGVRTHTSICLVTKTLPNLRMEWNGKQIDYIKSKFNWSVLDYAALAFLFIDLAWLSPARLVAINYQSKSNSHFSNFSFNFFSLNSSVCKAFGIVFIFNNWKWRSKWQCTQWWRYMWWRRWQTPWQRF